MPVPLITPLRQISVPPLATTMLPAPVDVLWMLREPLIVRVPPLTVTPLSVKLSPLAMTGLSCGVPVEMVALSAVVSGKLPPQELQLVAVSQFVLVVPVQAQASPEAGRGARRAKPARATTASKRPERFSVD